jgi:dihydroorotate dehydrogenase
MISSASIGEAAIEFLGHMAPSNKLEKNLFGIQFDTPVGLSGIIDPHLSGLKAFQNLGFGFIEIGPVSICGSSRKEELYVDQKQEQVSCLEDFLMNLSTVKERLHSLKKKKMPFFIMVEGTFHETKQICEELLPFSDGFIMNTNTFDSANQFDQLRDKLSKPVILACSAENNTSIEKVRDFCPNGILLKGSDSPEEHSFKEIF